MEKNEAYIKSKISQYKDAVRRLNESIEKDDGSDFLQDSIIQRFEFCIELARKTGKKVLEWQGYSNIRYPKQALQIMQEADLIKNIADRNNFLEYRNILSHCYDAKSAYEIADKIKDNVVLFTDLAKSFAKLLK